MALSLQAPLVSPPGTATRYVNVNYLLLGLLLQQVHGRNFDQLVEGLVAGHGLSASRVEPPDRLGWPGFASGGIVGTAADMVRWGDALLSRGRVLGPAEWDAMTTIGPTNEGLGVWGMCPCLPPTVAPAVPATSPELAFARFTAIGHSTAAGRPLPVPRVGAHTLAVRLEPEVGDPVGRAVAVHQALLGALRS